MKIFIKSTLLFCLGVFSNEAFLSASERSLQAVRLGSDNWQQWEDVIKSGKVMKIRRFENAESIANSIIENVDSIWEREIDESIGIELASSASKKRKLDEGEIEIKRAESKYLEEVSILIKVIAINFVQSKEEHLSEFLSKKYYRIKHVYSLLEAMNAQLYIIERAIMNAAFNAAREKMSLDGLESVHFNSYLSNARFYSPFFEAKKIFNNAARLSNIDLDDLRKNAYIEIWEAENDAENFAFYSTLDKVSKMKFENDEGFKRGAKYIYRNSEKFVYIECFKYLKDCIIGLSHEESPLSTAYRSSMLFLLKKENKLEAELKPQEDEDPNSIKLFFELDTKEKWQKHIYDHFFMPLRDPQMFHILWPWINALNIAIDKI